MLKNQINSSKEALLLYAFCQNKFNAINGKMMFIQGSPILKKHGQIKTGRLSGIVANHVPFFYNPIDSLVLKQTPLKIGIKN